MARCAVTVVTGPLGSGKSSVVRSLAEQFGPSRVAVISNELTRLDHDAQGFREAGLRVVSVCGECGSQRPGVIAEAIDEASALCGVSRVIIELAGTGDPGPMLRTLADAGDERWDIDGVVVAIDARTVLDDRLELDAAAPGTIGLGTLIERQITHATAVIVTDAGGLDSGTLSDITGWVDTINPDAIIETTSDGGIRAGSAIDPVWCPVPSESRSSGQVACSAMVFESRRPLHPRRLQDAMDAGWFPGLRIKGTAWLANSLDHLTRWDQNADELTLSPGPRWWAATPPAEWPEAGDQRAEIFGAWEAPSGDRRQALSVVGQRMSRAQVASALERCLLTDEEFALGPAAWDQWAPCATGTLRLAA